VQKRTGHKELMITTENKRSTDPWALGHTRKQRHVSFTPQNSEHDSPPLYKVLPDVIAQPI